MIWYEIHLLKKLEKGPVPISIFNLKTFEKFIEAGYAFPRGPVPKGKNKGKNCVILQPAGKKYREKLQKEKKEDRRFWIALWMNPISAIIGAAFGSILTYILMRQ